MEGVTKGFVIRGRVQGVGFRWWTRQTADALGVVGTVRNLPDGTVRVIARADEEAMLQFADKLRDGPPFSRVEAVEESAAELADDVGAFTIEHR